MNARPTPLEADSSDLPMLWDMREAALAMIRLTRGMSFEDFAADAMLVDSIERGIGIMGRAARLLAPDLRAQNEAVPWRQLIGAARMLADPEDALEAADLWRVVEGLPAIVRAISPLIPEEPDA